MTATQIDSIMQAASEALARMDYLEAEALCLEALGRARQAGDWAYYGRILLPLQECRRQRRMIAAAAGVRLGTGDIEADTCPWPATGQAGCIVVTHPHTAETARSIEQTARQQRRYIEVLLADNPSSAEAWTLRSFAGPTVQCVVPAPDPSWRDRWLTPSADEAVKQPVGPADWFLDACEALGDAALASVQHPPGTEQRIAALEQCLEVVRDHEILHQQLGQAARAMRPREVRHDDNRP